MQDYPQKKSLSFSVKHGDSSVDLNTKDTNIYDMLIVGIIVFCAIALTYIIRKVK